MVERSMIMNKTINALLLGCMGIQSIVPATVVLASEKEQTNMNKRLRMRRLRSMS